MFNPRESSAGPWWTRCEPSDSSPRVAVKRLAHVDRTPEVRYAELAVAMSDERHNEAMSSPRVLIVGDDSLARAGLVALVSTLSEVELVGQAAAADDAASTLDAFKPDIALWDLGWSPDVAFERLAEYNEAEVSVVALVSHEEHASRARASGARGVLARDVGAASLQAALAAVAQGMLVLDPELTPTWAYAGPPGDAVEALTRRELQVLRLLAEGSPNKAIAYRLDISDHTVKFHVNSIFTKLHAQSRTEAVAIATRLGLILL